MRPATQSLGAGGCGDCHAPDAAFFYGQVSAGSPSEVGPGVAKPMYEFQGLEWGIVEVLARTIVFRPAAFWVGLGAVGLLALLLIYYGLPGLARLLGKGKR